MDVDPADDVMTQPTDIRRHPIDRVCLRCLAPFVITPDDQEYFARKAAEAGGTALILPVRCRSCRAARRRERLVVCPDSADLQMVCRACRGAFVFTEADQAFYARMDFLPPRRCRDCRRAGKPSFVRGNQ